MPGAGSGAMADPAAKGKPSSGEKSALETICEPGRHVDCLHAKMAQRRAAGKAGR